MITFGVDIPLIEVIFALSIIIFILLVEAIVIILLLVKNMKKTKKLTALMRSLSETLLEIKKKEIEELDRIRRT